MKKLLLVLLAVLLSACSATTVSDKATPTASSTAAMSPTPSLTATFTASPTQVPNTPTPTQVPFTVCCPLEDETFESLSLILTKSITLPANFGQDFGHPGLDFAYFQRGDRVSIQGIEVYAILSGTTVLTLDDDYPYGYTIMIETLLDDLPEDLREELMAAYLPVPENVEYTYNCPDVQTPVLTGEYSLYHLYAHLEAKPNFTRGDSITCGTKLGTVGNSGWSSNPHLHLETRLGPSGLSFTTMAHYDTTVSVEQLSNYCLWRSSGYYQVVDPFVIFGIGN